MAAKNIGAQSLLEFVPQNNYYKTIEATNFLLNENVKAILAPKNREIAQMVQTICDEKDIPVLDIHPLSNPTVINIYPSQKKLLEAYLELLKTWNYEEFIVLYDDEESLVKIAEILKLYNGQQMVLKQLDKHKNGNYRYLKQKKKKTKMQLFFYFELGIFAGAKYQLFFFLLKTVNYLH